MEPKWRFPRAYFGKNKGLSTGDLETFKKTPYSSFAREILQNSIDAQENEDLPVRVEFKTFEMDTNKIPGISELKEQVRRCKEFYSYKQDYVEEYNRIENELNKDKIICLRVSDYNTTGLIGVEEANEKENNHFLALTKGSGVSEKSSKVAGGSKGVGKNAAFLMSKTNIVFYSTKTSKNINGEYGEHFGSFGVANFVSGYVNDELTENRDYTQGEGYFSSNDINASLNDILDLNNDSNRKNETGTDIYIIGFRNEEGWIYEIINSILDSFLTTIYKERLEVRVDDYEINANNLNEIISMDGIKNKELVSQYRLLTDSNVVEKPIITEYGECELKVLIFSKSEEEYATNKCTMIRYPFMKINDFKITNANRVSAMCIIGNDELGERLRSVENPQHNNWEPKRILDDKSLKKEMESLISELKENIKKAVYECLCLDNEDPLDPYGAGEFLPDESFGENNIKAESESKNDEKTIVSKEKEVKLVQKNASQVSDYSQCLEPDVGDSDDEIEGEVEHPTGNNSKNGGDIHGGDETSSKKEGDNIIMTRSKLSGVKYKLIAIDKKLGKFRIVFISPITCEECYLRLERMDDSNKKEKIEIYQLSKNKVEINGNNKFEYGPFNIKLNEKVTLDFTCNVNDNFASAISVICIDKGVINYEN